MANDMYVHNKISSNVICKGEEKELKYIFLYFASLYETIEWQNHFNISFHI